MNAPLRILHLEDDSHDAEMVHETARSRRHRLRARLASRREGEFLAALDGADST